MDCKRLFRTPAVSAWAWLLVGALFFPSPASSRTDWPIVIPAFQNVTGDAEWDWLSVGLPDVARTKLHGTIYMRAFTWEEISHVVSQDPSLAGNFPEIARRLRSDLVVMGSYRVDGDAIELSATCVDPVSGRQLATFKSMGAAFEPAAALNGLILQISQALRIAVPPDQLETVNRQTTSIVDAFKAHATGLIALTREDRRQSAVSDAKGHFQEAIALDPKFADAHYRLATLLQHEGDLAGAEASYRNAVSADVDHRDARYRLGLMLIDQNRKSEAMTELEQALKQAPEDPQMQAALSSIWFDQYQSNFQQMADGIKQAIAASPDDANLYVELGGVYEELSKVKEAGEQYRIALQKDPKHGDAAYKLGMIERNIGTPATTISLFKQAIQNNTGEKRVHYYLGEMLVGQGKHKEAAAAFAEGVKLEPNHTPGYAALANAHAEAGQHQDALLAYGQYARLNKDDARPHAGIGRAYKAMGLPKQAMTAFKKSVEVDPKYAEGHIAIAELYEDQKLTFRAADAYKEALRLRPDHPRAEELKELIRKYQPAPTGNIK